MSGAVTAPARATQRALVAAAAVGLAASVMRLLLRSFRNERAPTEDPQTAAEVFCDSFLATYGQRSPAFLRCSYREALQRANRESKFLLLYLHSGEHQVCAEPALLSRTR